MHIYKSHLHIYYPSSQAVNFTFRLCPPKGMTHPVNSDWHSSVGKVSGTSCHSTNAHRDRSCSSGTFQGRVDRLPHGAKWNAAQLVN